MTSVPKHFKHAALALLVLASLNLAGCQDEAKTSPAASAESREAADPRLVTVPENFGAQLKVEALSKAPVADTLSVAGKVDFDQSRLTRIGASVTGRITEIQVFPGQPVQVGDSLAVLNSTELGQAQLNYLKARAQADLQARSVERARQLFAADVIGQAELQRRESELAVASAEQRGAADQLKVLGVSPAAINRLGSSGAINSVSTVAATIAGTVVERNVTVGQVVQPAESLFVVADLSRVWVTAEVPEQQAGQVKMGQVVDIDVPALGQRLRGKLIQVGDAVNPETRTLTVRSEVDNKDRSLKPAMLATMLIQAAPIEQLVVPARAVVREGDADFVFLEQAAGRFRLAPVKLGPDVEGRRAVLSGLQAGQRVLTDGAFHLNNERKRKELE
ncbi:MAG: efflux RND transporter periplasmic adaptor subunit [Rhodocyclales bacterium]|nr:efflux RND transporter periplasmic adaptor subunit [Rhodocyclales bacterium]